MREKGTVWVLGASSGLGRSVADAFYQKGWLVVAGARSFTQEKREIDEAQYTRLPLDVTREESCDEFARQALEISPRVDAMVCCAALLVLGSCENTGMDELKKVMETNVLGTVRMIQRGLPLMRAQGKGKIIIFSSINGLLGIPFQSAYTMSKHALEGYAECLAMETWSQGIRVCLVEPGDHKGGSSRTRLHAAKEKDASVYYKSYQNACEIIQRDEENGLSPERLGKIVVRNAERRHMRFRLRIAKPDQRLAVWLHEVTPACFQYALLRSYYRTRS